MERHDSAADPRADNPRPRRTASEREVVRQVREANREAIREAREAARESHRQALSSVRETVRLAREAERETLRQVRSAPGAVAGEVDTRSRIQQVAIELFTDNGYEATSLREIAEHLGVTKAALYYHFKTKDEIVESLVADRLDKIGELIAWAGEQPRSPEVRRELLRRYSTMLHEHDHHKLMRFFERNQSSMTQHKAGTEMRKRMMQMLDLISDRTDPLTDQIRCSLAIFALHSTWFTVRDPEIGEDDRQAAALEVALGLLTPATDRGAEPAG